MKVTFYLLILCFSLTSGCKKDVEIDNKPFIELIDVGPDQIRPNIDSIYFRISYKDGNGDLGSGDPSANNLFVTDNRINLQYKYRIQELVPGNEKVPISGILSFSINNTIHTGSSASDEAVSYSIFIVDGEGNHSNTVTTRTLTVLK